MLPPLTLLSWSMCQFHFMQCESWISWETFHIPVPHTFNRPDIPEAKEVLYCLGSVWEPHSFWWGQILPSSPGQQKYTKHSYGLKWLLKTPNFSLFLFYGTDVVIDSNDSSLQCRNLQPSLVTQKYKDRTHSQWMRGRWEDITHELSTQRPVSLLTIWGLLRI